MRNKAIEIRPTQEEDAPFLAKWLMDPAVLRWFPMHEQREIDDAVRIWVGYHRIGSALTATWEGEPCGMSTLYIQPFKKLAHTCLFSIIVGEEYRGKGVGLAILEEVSALAKNRFHIETLHLEVYDGNPARRLYERFGFVEYGRQPHFIKDHGEFIAKVFMQKQLV